MLSSAIGVPVSSGERDTSFFPVDVGLWVATDLAFKHNAPTFHQFLDHWLCNEERRSGFPRPCLLLCDTGVRHYDISWLHEAGKRRPGLWAARQPRTDGYREEVSTPCENSGQAGERKAYRLSSVANFSVRVVSLSNSSDTRRQKVTLAWVSSLLH